FFASNGAKIPTGLTIEVFERPPDLSQTQTGFRLSWSFSTAARIGYGCATIAHLLTVRGKKSQFASAFGCDRSFFRLGPLVTRPENLGGVSKVSNSPSIKV